MAVAQQEKLDFSRLDAIIEPRLGKPGMLIPVLQEAQDAYGYLPKEVMQRIALKLGVPFSQVYGVATFYSQFYLQRRGRNVIKICDGTACHVHGSTKLIDRVERELGIDAGETTPDYEFTFEVVHCLGACALSPAAVVNGEVMRHANAQKLDMVIERAREKK